MGASSRRDFLHGLSAAAGTAVLAPVVVSCNRQADITTTPPPDQGSEEAGAGEEMAAGADPMVLPLSRPEGWDPIAFNRARGNAGAVPESYHESINGSDGPLGKHVPYAPAVAAGVVPEGFVAVMFGNDEQGYPKHPASAPEGDAEGHWYDWIRVRRAVEDEAEEVEARFSSWPELAEGDTGQYAVQGGGDMTADAGRNTIYLVPLPPDYVEGETLRVLGHCSLHGEYVDFLAPQFPAADE